MAPGKKIPRFARMVQTSDGTNIRLTNVGQYKPWTIQTLDQDSRRNSTDVGQRKIIILILDLKKIYPFID